MRASSVLLLNEEGGAEEASSRGAMDNGNQPRRLSRFFLFDVFRCTPSRRMRYNCAPGHKTEDPHPTRNAQIGKDAKYNRAWWRRRQPEMVALKLSR